MQWRTCSLVSTSGLLLNSSHGASIDGADAVIRLGWGPVPPSLKVHLGERTTVRMASNTAFSSARNISRESVHTALKSMTVPSQVIFLTLDGWCADSMSALASCYPKLEFKYVVDKEPALGSAARCLRKYTGRNVLVTTGLMSIFHLLITRACASLQLYGFDDAGATSVAPYHYYSTGQLSDGGGALLDKYARSRKGGHDFAAEHRLLRALSTAPTAPKGPLSITRKTVTALCAITPSTRKPAPIRKHGSCYYPICGERPNRQMSTLPRPMRTSALAWASMCIQHSPANVHVLGACLTSIGSLLLTRTRFVADVVAVLDDLAMDGVGGVLRRNGVRTVIAPSVEGDAALLQRDWVALKGRFKRNTTVPRQVLALYKMRTWLLTDYHAVVYFDIDVLFLRDPLLLMQHSPSFAAIRMRNSAWGCGGRDYLNAGVMMLEPSRHAYTVLRATFLCGNFTDCGGSSATLDDQDVVRQLAFHSTVLGTFHEWPLCFNYRGWPWQRHCRTPILIHQESSARPSTIRDRAGSVVQTNRIPELMRRGACAPPVTLRASVRPYVVLERYWNASQTDAAREQVKELMDRCHLLGEGNDLRTMGAETLVRRSTGFGLIDAFNRDGFFAQLAASHLGMRQPVPTYTLLSSTGPNGSSGGGWHKDAPHSGIKALMYLDDVGPLDGPFAMLLNYKNEHLSPNGDQRRTRYDAREVARHVENRGAAVHAITAPRGTVVLFETSSVHRGTVREAVGNRVVMTNYYNNRLPPCGSAHG